MSRFHWSIAVFFLLLMVVFNGTAVAQQPLDAEEIKAVLRTAQAEEDGFVDYVVGLVERGTLPRSLVDGTLQWARRKSQHRFQYFRRALILRAARMGIRI